MNDRSPRAIFERCVELLKSGAREEAEQLCRKQVEADPDDMNFVSLLGSILATRGAQVEAIGLLSKVV